MTAETYVAPHAAPTPVRATGMIGYCPWRHLSHLEGVTLRWHDVGPWGLTDFEARTISLLRGMSEAEKRSTLAHELTHIERGPGFGPEGSARSQVEEHVVDLTAALRLIPAYVLEDLPQLVERHGVAAVQDILCIDDRHVRDALEAVERLRASR